MKDHKVIAVLVLFLCAFCGVYLFSGAVGGVASAANNGPGAQELVREMRLLGNELRFLRLEVHELRAQMAGKEMTVTLRRPALKAGLTEKAEIGCKKACTRTD